MGGGLLESLFQIRSPQREKIGSNFAQMTVIIDIVLVEGLVGGLVWGGFYQECKCGV